MFSPSRAAAAAAVCLLLAAPAKAVTIDATVASAVASAPFSLANFGDAGTNGFVSNAPVGLANGTVTFGATNASARAGVYDGSVSGLVASPANHGNYVAAQPGSDVTFSFNAPQTLFQLLWGSVDSYNTLTFFNGDTRVATVTGSDVIGQDHQSNTAAYVTLSDLGGTFDRVVASSSSPAFEFLPNVPVPEPGTLAVVGAGLAGLAFLRRRTAG